MSVTNLNSILNSLNIKAECVNFSKIENYYYYDLSLKPKGKVKDIQKYIDEISLFLKSSSRPNIKVVHEQGVVRLEFVEPRKSKLDFYSYIKSQDKISGDIVCLLGQSSDGEPVYMDLSKNPHLLIAGTTGSGKSTLLHNIIANCALNSDIKMYLVDTKKIEFNDYDAKIPVSYSYVEAVKLLENLIETMNSRYEAVKDNPSHMKYFNSIVVIIDEFADLIMQDTNDVFYNNLSKLAQKCRAAKIHLVMATQRPSANIVNGNIKANFPARISCKVSSNIDSKIILDSSGAENLLGHGDALLKDQFRDLQRFQVAYVNPKETVQRLAL